MFRSSPPQWRRLGTPIALAIVSVFAALALWVAVTDAEHPRSVRDFPAAIPIRAVNVPEGMAVFGLSQTVVSVRVSATEDDFQRLTTANFVAEIDLFGTRQATSSQVVSVRVVGIDDVEIAAVTPNVVDVALEAEASKQVPVQVVRLGTPPQGYGINAIEANPEQVRVVGAATLVHLVESAATDINLTGIRANIQGQYRLTARDASGAEVPRVRVEPGQAEVRVIVSPQTTALVVPIEAQFEGTPAPGYNVISVTLDPQMVTLTGSAEALQGVARVATQPIDINNISSDQTRSVPLRVPGALQASRETVNVTIRVAPAQGARTFTIAPEVVDLPDGLRAVLQTQFVTVRVRGDEPVLRNLPAGAISARVSLNGLEPGSHTLPVEVSVPSGITLVSTEPAQVALELLP